MHSSPRDTSNLCVRDSAARLRGFEDDLGLKGQEFNTLLSILYVGYILMQIPSYVVFCSRETMHQSCPQEYVSQLHREALDLPPLLHDHLGYDFLPDWCHQKVRFQHSCVANAEQKLVSWGHCSRGSSSDLSRPHSFPVLCSCSPNGINVRSWACALPCYPAVI